MIAMQVDRAHLLAITLCFSLVSSIGEHDFREWSSREVLDKRYQLFWTAEKSTVMFQVEVVTKGWVGFGLSPHGRLAMSDVVVGWVKGNQSNFYDMHANKKGELLVDKSQDWKLHSAYEKGSLTVLKFSRRMETCDSEDWLINTDTQRVIFAYSPNDPKSLDDLQHQSSKMWNSKSVKLIQPYMKRVPIPNDVSYWDIRADNVTLPGNQDTYYYCKIYRGLPLKRKHHVIKVAPLIRLQNTEHVHHLTFYRCADVSQAEGDAAVGLGGVECGQPNLPPLFRRCFSPYASWLFGQRTYVYPQHVGAPLGENNTGYFMIQIHYDNPMFLNNITDDSGIRLYYTPRVRRYDSSMIWAGAPVSPLNVIPPGQKEFIIAGHISSDCLAQAVPEGGIHVFAVFLHAHLIGVKMQMRHFRGNKELRPINKDMNYDNHFQEVQYLEKEITILPGDHLVTECTYDSTGRNTTTFGGPSTREEMCDTVFIYYPPMPIGIAYSAPSPEIIAGLTGMDLASGNYNVSGIEGGVGSASPSYYTYLRNYDWSQTHMCTIQNAIRFSPHTSYCITTNAVPLTVGKSSYPDHWIPYKSTDPCKRKERNSRSSDRPRCSAL